MPFINSESTGEIVERFAPYEDRGDIDFGEAFDASVGLAFDEGLSVSHMLNREGWDTRRAMIEEKIKAGEIDNVDKYRTANGRNRNLDYNRIAEDLQDPNIKTDAQLNQERNEFLAMKRGYAQDVIERGSGAAQFLGSLNAYALDPINVLTLGYAAPATAARATSIVGRAALAAKDAALISAAAELGIQGLVYQHRQTIQSPYSAGDALAAVGFAATGAAALGGVAGGLGAYFAKVRGVADQLPDSVELQAAKRSLERMEETLRHAPKADTPEAQIKSDIEFLQELNARAEQFDGSTTPAAAYDLPEIQQPVERPAMSASQREREVLARQGMAEAYDADMAKFNELENPIIRLDDEDINARELVDQYTQEIQGLDDVLRCAYG